MRLACLVFTLIASAFAQTDGILTAASRNVTVTADQADFTVAVATGLDVTADQVIQIFQTAGLQNLNLAGSGIGQNYDYASGNGQLQTQAIYQLSFSVAVSSMKDAAKKLEALRTRPPDGIKSLQFGALTSASQAAVDAARQTTLPILIADAQKKGQSLAAAAGVKLGAIKAVSESAYSGAGTYAYSNFLLGSLSSSQISTSTGTQYTFYASVTFALAP